MRNRCVVCSKEIDSTTARKRTEFITRIAKPRSETIEETCKDSRTRFSGVMSLPRMDNDR